MAEIDIQEKRGQPMWVWIAAIVALLVVAGVVWALVANNDDRDDATMRQDTVPTMRQDTVPTMRQDTVPTRPGAPTSGLDRAQDMVLASVTFSEAPMRMAAYR
jgi:hypothetical protein